MKFVFDLDGTIAPYKKDIPKEIAEFLNTLGRIYVITGGKTAYAKKACKALKNATIIGMADSHDSIDLAKILKIDKEKFNNNLKYQKIRINLVDQINQSLKNTNLRAYTGGRSTIDIMNIHNTKAHAVDGDITYFYDCKWEMNISKSNDYPMILKATRTIKTNWKRVIKDIKACQQ